MRTFAIIIAAISLLPAMVMDVSAGPATTLPRLANPVLTNAAQILKLTAAQAARAIPVKLRGVVIDESQPREHALILADQSASVYLLAITNLFAPYHQKDLLEISGFTSQGEFAPCVVTTKAQKLGDSPLPAARPVTYQQLITGALDAQFVQITGVVRRSLPASEGDETWRIVLAADGGAIQVRIPVPQDPLVQADAEVTLQAVCLYEFNQKRQALSPVLQVPRGLSVHILRPSPENPYAVPMQSLSSPLQFSPEIPYGHRIHVHGIVTCSQAHSLVWIRDESSSLRIQTSQGDDLQPGDEVDVLGFPSYGSSTPVLEDAIYRKLGTLTAPAPVTLTNASEAYNHQDDLVSMTAMLTEIRPVINGLALTLDEGNTVFKASLKYPLKPNVQPSWRVGSLVRVSGICDVVYDSSKPVMGIWHPESFQILLRSPADLTIIKWPPWWNGRHILYLLGLFTGGSLLASGVVMLSARRRLHEQAHRRAMAEVEFAAILSERNRLAREIHDTLAQGFTATLLQLQLVRLHSAGDLNSMRQHVDKAENLIRDGLNEARKSIWQMNPQALETGDLADALEDILKQLAGGIVADPHFEVVGRKHRLPPIVESNILRLGQEAITNAVKHAQAKQLNVKLEFGENQLSLVVADNGSGFDAANPPPSEGGFGLLGMKGRANELNGRLTICSAPNQGTEITLCVPLTGDSNSPKGGNEIGQCG